MIPWLRPTDPPESFPPVECALTEPDGLLCAGGDLSPARLLAAYRVGIFPWYSEDQPILWWSPDPRLVLLPDEFRISRSLGKTLRNRGFRISFNTRFRDVVANCAGSGERALEGTWISPEMHEAYAELHQMGFAHSVEVWDEDRLVGGLYGLKLGRVFFGESMFSVERDASKVALCQLVDALRARQVGLIDCQVASPHLHSLGARLMPRAEFVARLQRDIDDVVPGPIAVPAEA